ncbi:ABC transporter permease [Dietzia cinnamea]|uniref:NitT/TauT family transport system permease protein n=1 Tax=Dietzia cinnamea TaxID=321318 RepID=A0A4R3ZVM2_9ACTN|nr:ABC transporter permease [Dietzia cinnamea]TCW24635.1 NitT/TauT family transport system permease protein [Dietzia cinnamea]
MTRTDPTSDPGTDPVAADPMIAGPGAPGVGATSAAVNRRSDEPVSPSARRSRRGTGGGGLAARWGAGVVGLLLGLAVWALLTSGLVTDDPVIGGMSPAETWSGFGDLLERGVLVSDAAVSLYRLVAGLATAALLGVPLGLWLGLRRRAEAVAGPLVQFLRMISPLSWAPVAIAVFGIGNEPVIFLVAAAAIWPIMLSTSSGVHAMDPGYLDVARTMGASGWERLTRVVIPAVKPAILGGIRLALGTAWIVLVPAEMLGVRSGLGYQILNARDQLAYDQVMAVILVIGVLGFALDSLSRLLLRERTAR